jgi:hypothetical protein
MRSVLTGANATTQCTGEKRSLQEDLAPFSKNWFLVKMRCCALKNAPCCRVDAAVATLSPRRWRCLDDVGAVAATLAQSRRRWRCRGDIGAAAATVALSRRRWHCRGDIGAVAAKLALPRRR